MASAPSPDRPLWPAPDVAARLLPHLQKLFGYKVYLFPTPNLTGRYLWTLTRPNWRADYPVLPEPLHTFYRESGGQGRTEVTTLPQLETIPAAFVFDMRFAYAAACENLPVGPPEREAYPTPRPWDDGDRYTKGRYRVRFRIPAGWGHIGLLMVPRAKRNTGWHYPADPGGEYETWASNGEIALAVGQSWHIEVMERIVFPHTKAAPRPLDVWIERLQRLWHAAADDEPVQDAVRDIVLQTIGGFHSHRRRETITVPDSEPLPPGVLPLWDRAAHTLTFDRWAPLPGRDRPYQHPEWSMEVWARCRTKLLHHKGQGALTLFRQDVLGLRTDALYLARDPGWEDTGEIGAFRLKASRTGPLPAPHDAKHLRAIAGGD